MTNDTNTAAVSGAKLLQTAADAIDAMLHTCCNGNDISPVNAAWERGEKVLSELRAAIAAVAQPVAPSQAGEREAFENWVFASGRAHMLKRDDRNDWYADLTVTTWWTAWQARAARGAAQAAPVDAAAQTAIDSAPEPFRRLGKFLACTLDEDQWETAQSLLLGGLVAAQEGRDIQGDIDHYNENMG